MALDLAAQREDLKVVERGLVLNAPFAANCQAILQELQDQVSTQGKFYSLTITGSYADFVLPGEVYAEKEREWVRFFTQLCQLEPNIERVNVMGFTDFPLTVVGAILQHLPKLTILQLNDVACSTDDLAYELPLCSVAHLFTPACAGGQEQVGIVSKLVKACPQLETFKYTLAGDQNAPMDWSVILSPLFSSPRLEDVTLDAQHGWDSFVRGFHAISPDARNMLAQTKLRRLAIHVHPGQHCRCREMADFLIEEKSIPTERLDLYFLGPCFCNNKNHIFSALKSNPLVALRINRDRINRGRINRGRIDRGRDDLNQWFVDAAVAQNILQVLKENPKITTRLEIPYQFPNSPTVKAIKGQVQANRHQESMTAGGNSPHCKEMWILTLSHCDDDINYWYPMLRIDPSYIGSSVTRVSSCGKRPASSQREDGAESPPKKQKT